jgi:hypothetical protein
MAEPLILDPLDGYRAFRDDSSEAAWSQTAQLIGLGVQLRSGETLLEGLTPEVERLKLPRVSSIEPMTPTVLADRLRSQPFAFRAVPFFIEGLPFPPDLDLGRISPDILRWIQPIMWEELANSDQPNPNGAVALLFVNLFSNREINRVASAAVLQPLLTEVPPFIHSILVDGCFSGAETIRHLAANTLARFDPENPALSALVGEGEADPGRDPAHTSTIIHGTWGRWKKPRSRGAKWWEPGSNFFNYIRDEVSADLYAGNHYYRWSGGYHNQDRAQGAEGLRRWCAVHHVSRFDVLYAHSYGAALALLASMPGEHYPPIRARVAMLLSAPAVIPAGCDFSGFTRVLSLRSRFDFVLLADGTIGSFQNPIEELRAPIPFWYGHGATHSRFVWRRLEIARELRFELDNTPWKP